MLASCYARAVIPVRAGQGPLRPARLFLSMIAGLAIVGGCVSGASTEAPTDEAAASPAPATASGGPSASTPGGPSPSGEPLESATPDVATSSPRPSDGACTGDEKNREFFHLAAGAMSWPVYCAVLGEGWFLTGGRYELANGGHLEVTYRGPADVHVALVEGTICSAGSDVETCAPRDAVIGTASFGDREGELGRLGNGLVLDVDRGATPSWRASGVGLSEDDFRTIGADLILVDD